MIFFTCVLSLGIAALRLVYDLFSCWFRSLTSHFITGIMISCYNFISFSLLFSILFERYCHFFSWICFANSWWYSKKKSLFLLFTTLHRNNVCVYLVLSCWDSSYFSSLFLFGWIVTMNICFLNCIRF